MRARRRSAASTRAAPRLCRLRRRPDRRIIWSKPSVRAVDVRQVRGARTKQTCLTWRWRRGLVREVHWGRAVLTISRGALRGIRLRHPSVLAVLDSLSNSC
jgi:hypothetical protein